jgi:hypothetical protein
MEHVHIATDSDCNVLEVPVGRIRCKIGAGLMRPCAVRIQAEVGDVPMTVADDRPRPATSLSVRLVAAALVWLAVLLAVGGVVLALAFRDTVEQEFSRRLDAMLKAMIAATEIAPDGKVVVVRPLGDPRFEQIFSGWYWEVTEPGGRQVRSRSLWDSVIEPVDGGTRLHTRRVDGPNGEPLLVVERDLLFPDAKGPVHLLVAGDLREVSDGVRRFDLLLLASLGLLGLGMAVAIVIQVRYGLRPLRAMAADLQSAREGAAATDRAVSARGCSGGGRTAPRDAELTSGRAPCRQPRPC